MPILGGHRSKYIVVHLHDNAGRTTGELPSMIYTFEQLHRKKDKWINDEATIKHSQMNEIRATQHANTDVASSAASCDVSGINTEFPPHMDIVTEVLGPRCRYKKGFGQLPRLNAIGEKRSTKTSTSTPHEVSPDANAYLIENLKKHNEELSKKEKKFFNRTRRHENMLKEMMGYMSTVIPNFSMTMEESDS